MPLCGMFHNLVRSLASVTAMDRDPALVCLADGQSPGTEWLEAYGQAITSRHDFAVTAAMLVSCRCNSLQSPCRRGGECPKDVLQHDHLRRTVLVDQPFHRFPEPPEHAGAVGPSDQPDLLEGKCLGKKMIPKLDRHGRECLGL